MKRPRSRATGASGYLRRTDDSDRSVFFSRFWIYGAITVVVLGVATGERGITLIGCLVGFAAGVTWAWNRTTLSRISMSRTFDLDRVFPGDTVEMTIELVNDKALPVPWITIDDEMSETLRLPGRASSPAGATGRKTFQLRTRLGPYEKVVWRIPVECPGRGLHAFGPSTIRAGDPLGFFSTRIERKETDAIVVYPRIELLPELHLPSRHAVGDVRAVRQLFVDPLRVVGIRDYRPEDPFKAIHWKASARQGSLQVRVAEPTTTLQLSIFANIDTFDRYWEGIDVAASERVIELAASIAVWAIDYRYQVSVFSNGVVAGSDQPLRVLGGRGAEQRLRVLEGLAKLSPYSSKPFIDSVRTGAAKLAIGSTAVVITSILQTGLQAHMLALVAVGHRVVLIPVGDCPTPAIRGLIVRRLGTDSVQAVSQWKQTTHG